MTITLKCPCCNAINKLTEEQTICRRCSENLKLLYTVKFYSVKYRIAAIESIIKKDLTQASFYLNNAFQLEKA